MRNLKFLMLVVIVLFAASCANNDEMLENSSADEVMLKSADVGKNYIVVLNSENLV